MLTAFDGLKDPASFLKLLYSLLNPNGVLAFSVANSLNFSIVHIFRNIDEEERVRRRSGNDWGADRIDRWQRTFRDFTAAYRAYSKIGMPKVYTSDQVKAMLKEAGFHVRNEAIDENVFGGQRIFFVAHRT